jgi:hypothetical protein
LASVAGWSGTEQSKGNLVMSLRYEFAQRAAVSMVAALFFTVILVNTATSFVPVA